MIGILKCALQFKSLDYNYVFEVSLKVTFIDLNTLKTVIVWNIITV